MMKVCKIVGIVSRPLQEQYLAADEATRKVLRERIAKERQWMIDKMAFKGYRLEGTVLDIYGVFTRGQATGTLKVLDHEVATVTA